MASNSITLKARAHGLWRLRVLLWLSRLMLPGVRLELRIGRGEWRAMPLGCEVEHDPEAGG